MSERSERLFGALSEISETKIDEAAPVEKKKQFHWKRWGAAAAALVLAAGVGSQVLPRLGGSSGSNGSGTPGADGASTFMSYAGPVFPLTLKETDSTITARREITLDFAPWVPVWWSNEEEADREGYTPEQRQETLDMYNEWYPEGGWWRSSSDIQVTDSYTLTNTSAEDKVISVLYPFAGELREIEEQTPELTADEKRLETALYAGGYSGGFAGAEGSESEGRWNLRELNSWEQYRDLLSDGSYQKRAFEDYPDLSDIPATVYKFTDPWGPEPDDKAGVPNPTLRNSFYLDYSKTVVLSYGFNGTSRNMETGWMDKQFSIPRPGAIDENDPCYLIVIGEDIGPIDTQGYATGGWDTKKTVEAGVTVQRYETDLESALRTALRQRYDRFEEHDWDFEMYFGLVKDQLVTYGILSVDPAERYGAGNFEDLDAHYAKRVFYLEAEVTIPAGRSVTLTATMTKKGSHDFYCAHTANQGVEGYDMVTKLGSNLACTAQTAVLEDRGQIGIVRQNFGFDLEKGVKQVTLDPEQEHYYLEIKRLPQE